MVYANSCLVERGVGLPPAVKAERVEFESPAAGRLSYYADRRGEGRPLVLVHSVNAAASAYEVRPLFERYRGSRPVYALDLPGFGFSERSDRAYGPPLYEAAVADLLRREVGEASDVVALSLGSEFAARAALEVPDLVGSLAMISPSGFSLPTGEGAPLKLGRATASNLAYLNLRLFGRASYGLLTSRPSVEFFEGLLFVGPVDRGLVEYAILTSRRPGARYAPLAFLAGRLFTPNVRAEVYERLEMPVLVLHDLDPFVGFAALAGFVGGRDNWRAVRVSPTRGLPHFERPEETAAALDGFWGGVARRGAA